MPWAKRFISVSLDGLGADLPSGREMSNNRHPRGSDFTLLSESCSWHTEPQEISVYWTNPSQPKATWDAKSPPGLPHHGIPRAWSWPSHLSCKNLILMFKNDTIFVCVAMTAQGRGLFARRPGRGEAALDTLSTSTGPTNQHCGFWANRWQFCRSNVHMNAKKWREGVGGTNP